MKEDLNTQISKFPVFIYTNKKIIPCDKIKTKDDYNHYTHHLHHFVKEQQYYRNPEKYEQKLILVPKEMHSDIHSYHSKFFDKWGVQLDEVILRG